MPPAARVGDPTGHPGVIGPPGVPTVLIGGMPAATVGTPHICSFPPPAVHPPTAIVPPGCPTVLIGGMPAARMGDMSACGAPIVMGAPTVHDRRLRWRMRRVPTSSAPAGRSRWAPTPPAASRWSTREREIEQAIRLILGTACGERPMRPEFGCRIHDHVFGPANAATAGQIAYDVREALERWEPRIEVSDVGVSFDAIDSGVLYVDVSYLIRGPNDPRNLVFPFYVIPDRAEPTAIRRRTARRSPVGQRRLTMLPAPNLDDRHFQDLVDDAKRLVQQRCPNWTDHNVSDPGVTLIEAFAQMVDQLIYRLNRVPDLQLRQVPRADRRRAAPAGRGPRAR